MGLLRVAGTIDPHQFWPDGESDADTTKVIVQTTPPKAFQFQPRPSSRFRVTHVFENARVVGKVSKPPIDKKGRVTIRLQGIDAPELHYSPSPLSRNKSITRAQRLRFKLLDKKYRQHFGETSTIKLHELLQQSGKNLLTCEVVTAVEEPNDVFDTYGRLVGDIFVHIKGKKLDLNEWLVENGWAFPTFYASMSAWEIKSFIAAAAKGAKKPSHLWQHLQRRVVGGFEKGLVYRGKGASPDPTDDVGPVIMPKLFRRLCTWWVYNRAGVMKGDFQKFLVEGRDGCFLREEFLEQGVTASRPYFLSDFLDSKGRFGIQPQDLVFSEKPSRLLGPDGKIITHW